MRILAVLVLVLWVATVAVAHTAPGGARGLLPAAAVIASVALALAVIV